MISLLFAAAISTSARAETDDHPCEAIKAACEAAGFVKGQAKKGTGLWKDCIEPLMHQGKQPAKATKPLPKIDESVIAACNAKHGINGGDKK